MANDASADDPGFLVAFDADDGRRLVVDDDGRTVYAYLHINGRISGDVWLANRRANPTSSAWNDRNDMPFEHKPALINAAEIARLPLHSDEQLSVAWDDRGVDLFVDNERVARIDNDADTGWCRFVTADSPLARKLP